MNPLCCAPEAVHVHAFAFVLHCCIRDDVRDTFGKMASRRVQAMSDDLKNVEFETSEEVEVTPTFDGMGLRDDLLRGIYAYGFEKPSAIQQRSVK